MRRWRTGIRVLCVFACALAAGCDTQSPLGTDDQPQAEIVATYPAAFAELALWDDGLSEMSYYDAVDTIYKRPRKYTRVLLLNREWLDPDDRVKADEPDPKRDIAVFKLNLVEQIPTENYNYRYMVTVFLNRATLRPEKLAASSQEWCGMTFKQIQWRPGSTEIRAFSYFGGEGDQVWSLPVEPPAYPEEALFILARAAAAAEQSMEINLLPPMRTTHAKRPKPHSALVEVADETSEARTPAGTFVTRRVTISGGARLVECWVEAVPPYRLVRVVMGKDLTMSLRFTERRPYWDQSNRSGFHYPGRAP